MTAQNFSYAIHGLLIAGTFLLWFYSAWQTYVIERTRDRLCELRDRWVDVAATHPECLDHPMYRVVWTLLSAQILWLHKITFPMMVMTFAACRGERRLSYAILRTELTELPTERLQREAWRLIDRAMTEVTRAVALRSLLFWVTILPALAAATPNIARMCVGRGDGRLRILDNLFCLNGFLYTLDALTPTRRVYGSEPRSDKRTDGGFTSDHPGLRSNLTP